MWHGLHKLGPRGDGGPNFYWRGVLIVLPVLALTVLGLISLRQDRVLAEAQARERAHELAEDLAQNVLAALKEGTMPGALAFEVDRNGELTFPPPLARMDASQPFLATELSSPEAALREKAQAQEWAGQGTDALRAYEAFLNLQPPTRFAAAAHYSRGVLLRKQGQTPAAVREFALVARDYPDAVSEGGVPFQALAQLNAMELASDQSVAIARSLGSNVVTRPSILSERILERIAALNRSVADEWVQRWNEQEQARTLYRAAQPHLKAEALFWSILGTNEWLVVKQREDTNSIRYAGWNDPLEPTVAQFVNKLPDYFGGSLELAGKAVVSSNDVPQLVKASGMKGAKQWWEKRYDGVPPPVYGTVSRYENGKEYLKAAVHLTSPQLLYERQRERALWFGLLIVATGAIAVFGYLSSLRAFQKQQRLAESKSNFVSSVSHELRAPIASVRLMAEGLERGTVHESAKQKEYFRFIVQECRRLSSLIENVLDFARIEQGRKEYTFQPTDLPLVMYQTASVMKPYASEQQVELRVIVNEADLAQLATPPLADGRALQQALINLIDNAIKHSPPNSVVTMGLSVPPHEIQLWVEDEGTGIPAAEHQKIFERFYRCGSELRRETQGVGIGLSIVKHIAEAHRGTVIVKSKVGQGSRFTIVLPLGVGASACSPAESHAEA